MIERIYLRNMELLENDLRVKDNFYGYYYPHSTQQKFMQ